MNTWLFVGNEKAQSMGKPQAIVLLFFVISADLAVPNVEKDSCKRLLSGRTESSFSAASWTKPKDI